MAAPAPYLGIRHSEYITPLIVDVSDWIWYRTKRFPLKQDINLFYLNNDGTSTTKKADGAEFSYSKYVILDRVLQTYITPKT